MNLNAPQRRLELLAALTIAIVFSAWVFFGTSSYWVGTATLVVEFRVSDAKTEAPIPGAQIEIRLLDRGPDPAHGILAFTLTTDHNGRAIRTEQVSHSGKDAPLGLSNTQAAFVPTWGARATAKGFDAGTLIGVSKLDQTPTGPAAYHVIVPMALTTQSQP